MPSTQTNSPASKSLSVLRARDREYMAGMAHRIAKNVGAKCKRETCPDNNLIRLHITAERGLSVIIDLDGNAPTPDVLSISWNLPPGSVDKLDNNAFGGAVIDIHQQQAADVGMSFWDLLTKLDKRLRQAQSGAAFLLREDMAENEDEPILRPDRIRG